MLYTPDPELMCIVFMVCIRKIVVLKDRKRLPDIDGMNPRNKLPGYIQDRKSRQCTVGTNANIGWSNFKCKKTCLLTKH